MLDRQQSLESAWSWNGLGSVLTIQLVHSNDDRKTEQLVVISVGD